MIIKKYIYAFLCTILFSVSSIAGELKKDEITALHHEIDDMLLSYEQGNMDKLLAKTHPSVYALVGGKEIFDRTVKQGLAQINHMDVKFLESKLGQPTKIFDAGVEEVCFVPRTSIMETQGQKVKNIGYMIAIRKKDGGEWFYLDGSAVAKNSELLWQLLPALTRDVQFPSSSVELID